MKNVGFTEGPMAAEYMKPWADEVSRHFKKKKVIPRL